MVHIIASVMLVVYTPGAAQGFCVRGCEVVDRPHLMILKNMGGKMKHSNAIWNANLELQRQVKNKIERVFLERFGTAEKKMKTRTVKGAFWRYLKQLGTAVKIYKTGMLIGSFWRYLHQFPTFEIFFQNKDSKWWNLTAFETIRNCRHNFENKDIKWCILTASDTIWIFRDHIENMDAKWCILTVFETI